MSAENAKSFNVYIWFFSYEQGEGYNHLDKSEFIFIVFLSLSLFICMSISVSLRLSVCLPSGWDYPLFK